MPSRFNSRRTLIKLAVTLPIAGVTATTLYKTHYKENSFLSKEILFSAQGRDNENFSLGWINNINSPSQAICHIEASKFRGHDICQNPTLPEQLVMMSRRPGLEGLVFDAKQKSITHIFNCKTGHHFQGHSCFSKDGKFIYCTESNYTTGEGIISVRETNTYQQIAEFKSYGIGPHQIELMPDGKTLVIANGGLLTHPDSGREVLNLDSMDSNLVYINSYSGKLINKLRLNDAHNIKGRSMEKASIRHLDVATDGTVAIGFQVQRSAMKNDQLVPLAAVHKKDKLHLLIAPNNLTKQLNDYMGSVKICNQSRTVGYTSPRGNLAVFWNIDDLTLNGIHNFYDVCGLSISADENYFILSNSTGKIRFLDSKFLKENKNKRLYFADQSWDNHMLSIQLSS